MVISTFVMVLLVKKKKALILRRATTNKHTYDEINAEYSGKLTTLIFIVKYVNSFQLVASEHDTSLVPSIETMTTQSQHCSDIDDITPNPSYTPQQQDTGEYENETVSRKLFDSTDYTHLIML